MHGHFTPLNSQRINLISNWSVTGNASFTTRLEIENILIAKYRSMVMQLISILPASKRVSFMKLKAVLHQTTQARKNDDKIRVHCKISLSLLENMKTNALKMSVRYQLASIHNWDHDTFSSRQWSERFICSWSVSTCGGVVKRVHKDCNLKYFQGLLTVSTHSNSQTFFKSTILASISVQSDYQAFAVSQTTVFDLFLDASTKKSLKIFGNFSIKAFQSLRMHHKHSWILTLHPWWRPSKDIKWKEKLL